MARNYRTRRGEIDLVLQEDASLVFVEVRYRVSIAFGRPEETVDPRKQSRLRLAAEAFLQRHQSGHDTSAGPYRILIGDGSRMHFESWIWHRLGPRFALKAIQFTQSLTLSSHLPHEPADR